MKTTFQDGCYNPRAQGCRSAATCTIYVDGEEVFRHEDWSSRWKNGVERTDRYVRSAARRAALKAGIELPADSELLGYHPAVHYRSWGDSWRNCSFAWPAGQAAARVAEHIAGQLRGEYEAKYGAPFRVDVADYSPGRGPSGIWLYRCDGLDRVWRDEATEGGYQLGMGPGAVLPLLELEHLGVIVPAEARVGYAQ